MIAVFYTIISRFGHSNADTSDKNIDISIVNYIPKKFLSNNEYNFLTNSRYNTELFRNIDFGIFNADYSKLLLLIELNDESHNNYHRKKRDIKVNDICNKAGIKLITFYTKYSNEKEYVKNRIKQELELKENLSSIYNFD